MLKPSRAYILLQYFHLNSASIIAYKINLQGWGNFNVLTKLYFIVCIRTSYMICLISPCVVIIPNLLISSIPLLVLVFAFLSFVVLFSGPNLAYPQVTSTNNSESLQNMSVKITSPKENQTIPIGELVVYGTSSDNLETNCHVFVDWNDVKPMQNVTGLGSGGKNDFSRWMFKYDNNYHLITQGSNELTSKISCSDNSENHTLASKYYTINVTGSTDLIATTVPASTGDPTINNSSTGFNRTSSFSILPQYIKTSTNDSLQDKESYQPITSNEDDSSKKFIIDVKNNSKNEDKSQSIDHLLSMKIEGDSNGADKILLKLRSGNSDSDDDSDSEATLKHRDLSKYIHNLIKEKLERVSERILD